MLPEDDESLADGIFGGLSLTPAEPAAREFLPWHKPRKQFVRDGQWCEQLERLIRDHPRDEQLKYLGLPGDDLLDIRMIYDRICEPRNLGLRFLGFNTALADPDSQSAANISLDEVRKLAWVDPLSDVISDNFFRMATSDSMAWKGAFEAGPFDVVNLDLCDGIVQGDPGSLDENYYNAITRLLALQTKQKRPWLLLITSLVGRDHVHPDVLQKLLERFERNLAECEDFKSACIDSISVGDAASLGAVTPGTAEDLSILICSICKWLAGLGIVQAPPSKVEVRSVIAYKVQPEAPIENMVSIALRIYPTFAQPIDPMGLASAAPAEIDECGIAVKALTRAHRRVNADEVLAGDAELKQKMIDGSALLLEKARYSAEAYRNWANELS